MNYLNEYQFKYNKEAKKIIDYHGRALSGAPEKHPFWNI